MIMPPVVSRGTLSHIMLSLLSRESGTRHRESSLRPLVTVRATHQGSRIASRAFLGGDATSDAKAPAGDRAAQQGLLQRAARSGGDPRL